MKLSIKRLVAIGSIALVGLMTLAGAAGAYSNNFDTDTAGWFNNSGTITKQPSGYDNDVYAEGIAPPATASTPDWIEERALRRSVALAPQ